MRMDDCMIPTTGTSTSSLSTSTSGWAEKHAMTTADVVGVADEDRWERMSGRVWWVDEIEVWIEVMLAGDAEGEVRNDSEIGGFNVGGKKGRRLVRIDWRERERRERVRVLQPGQIRTRLPHRQRTSVNASVELGFTTSICIPFSLVVGCGAALIDMVCAMGSEGGWFGVWQGVPDGVVNGPRDVQVYDYSRIVGVGATDKGSNVDRASCQTGGAPSRDTFRRGQDAISHRTLETERPSAFWRC
jgi:hypothetical protein